MKYWGREVCCCGNIANFLVDAYIYNHEAEVSPLGLGLQLTRPILLSNIIGDALAHLDFEIPRDFPHSPRPTDCGCARYGVPGSWKTSI